MTDEQLIARMRQVEWDPCQLAADRIEALVKERDDAVIKRAAWELEAKTQQARAERLEAALRFYADDETYETQYGRRSCDCCTDIFEPINDDRGAKARAALKGDDRD